MKGEWRPMEKQKISLENGKGTNVQKTRKVVTIILSVSLLIILAGVIIYQLLLSQTEEDIYFTSYNRDEKLSTLYCYDASQNQVIRVGEVEGEVRKGIVDDENKNFVYLARLNDNNYKLEIYDMENGRTEVLFLKGDIVNEIGMQLENIVFNKTIKGCMYLICSVEGENETCYYLVKYIPETGEMNVLRELITSEAWIAREEMVYYFNDTLRREHNQYHYAGPLCEYNSITNEESSIINTAGWDISIDGKQLIMCEKEENRERYYIYDLNTGETIDIASLSGVSYYIFSYKQIRFIGDSDNCVCVRSMRTIFDSYVDSSIWIKEPGHLPRKIFSFGIFSPSEDITILY